MVEGAEIGLKPYPERAGAVNFFQDEKIEMLFNKLSEGATDITPLKTESWGDTFGQLTDKFNVDWMVNITAK